MSRSFIRRDSIVVNLKNLVSQDIDSESMSSGGEESGTEINRASVDEFSRANSKHPVEKTDRVPNLDLKKHSTSMMGKSKT